MSVMEGWIFRYRLRMGFIWDLLRSSSRMGSGSERRTDLHRIPCFQQIGVVKESLKRLIQLGKIKSQPYRLTDGKAKAKVDLA